jgi:FtsZ-binding cell division protein ZapB
LTFTPSFSRGAFYERCTNTDFYNGWLPLVFFLFLFYRELRHTLTNEKRSLSKTKAYLKEQQELLRERQAALRQTHAEWDEGMKTHRERKVRKEVRCVCVCGGGGHAA